MENTTRALLSLLLFVGCAGSSDATPAEAPKRSPEAEQAAPAGEADPSSEAAPAELPPQVQALDALLAATTLPHAFDLESDEAGPMLTDKAFIAEVLKGDTDSPLEWDVRARWEQEGTRAWLIVQTYHAGAGVYDVSLLTFRDGAFAAHALGRHALSECDVSDALKGRILSDGSVEITKTQTRGSCEGEEPASSTSTTQVYKLDGSSSPVVP